MDFNLLKSNFEPFLENFSEEEKEIAEFFLAEIATILPNAKSATLSNPELFKGLVQSKEGLQAFCEFLQGSGCCSNWEEFLEQHPTFAYFKTANNAKAVLQPLPRPVNDNQVAIVEQGYQLGEGIVILCPDLERYRHNVKTIFANMARMTQLTKAELMLNGKHLQMLEQCFALVRFGDEVTATEDAFYKYHFFFDTNALILTLQREKLTDNLRALHDAIIEGGDLPNEEETQGSAASSGTGGSTAPTAGGTSASTSGGNGNESEILQTTRIWATAMGTATTQLGTANQNIADISKMALALKTGAPPTATAPPPPAPAPAPATASTPPAPAPAPAATGTVTGPTPAATVTAPAATAIAVCRKVGDPPPVGWDRGLASVAANPPIWAIKTGARLRFRIVAYKKDGLLVAIPQIYTPHGTAGWKDIGLTQEGKYCQLCIKSLFEANEYCSKKRDTLPTHPFHRNRDGETVVKSYDETGVHIG